jgi:hypothetical protein
MNAMGLERMIRSLALLQVRGAKLEMQWLSVITLHKQLALALKCIHIQTTSVVSKNLCLVFVSGLGAGGHWGDECDGCGAHDPQPGTAAGGVKGSPEKLFNFIYI